MKKLKPILFTIIILSALTAGAYALLTKTDGGSRKLGERIGEDMSGEGERAFRYDLKKTSTPLRTEGEDKNVLNFNSKNVYDVKTSDRAAERIGRLVNRMRTGFDNPIIAANPFGTNENSFYFYFVTDYKGMVRYTVTVEDEKFPDIIRYVNNGQENNLSKTHEFTVSGLVPGEKNYIVIEVLDSTGASREYRSYSYSAPDAAQKSKLRAEQGYSEENSIAGLYFVFPKGDSRIYAYDNSGVLRNVTVTEGGHGHRLYQSGDSILYQVSDTKVAKVSAIGRVTGAVGIKNYGRMKDFSYDGYGNIYALASKKGRDYLLSASFDTGKTSVVYEFPKGVEAVSVSEPAAGNIYVAAAEPDGIVKIGGITSNAPRVRFVLGKKSAWKKTALKKKAVNDREAQNWGIKNALVNLEEGSDGTDDVLSAYFTDKGKGTGFVFTVKGKEKKTADIRPFPVGQGGRCFFQRDGQHFVFSSLGRGWYEEYDAKGKVTKRFSFGKALDGMTKCSLNGLCFYTGRA